MRESESDGNKSSWRREGQLLTESVDVCVRDAYVRMSSIACVKETKMVTWCASTSKWVCACVNG